MQYFFDRFIRADDGNTTVEWVVLLTGALALTISAGLTLRNGSLAVAEETSNAMTEADAIVLECRQADC